MTTTINTRTARRTTDIRHDTDALQNGFTLSIFLAHPEYNGGDDLYTTEHIVAYTVNDAMTLVPDIIAEYEATDGRVRNATIDSNIDNELLATYTREGWVKISRRLR